MNTNMTLAEVKAATVGSLDARWVNATTLFVGTVPFRLGKTYDLLNALVGNDAGANDNNNRRTVETADGAKILVEWDVWA